MRIDHREDTKLAVDAEEQGALLERMRSGATASTTGSYHFICECFFLTAKGLHLGFVKTVQDLYNLARVSHEKTNCHMLAPTGPPCDHSTQNALPTR